MRKRVFLYVFKKSFYLYAEPEDEVKLLDAEERPLGSHIGPFVEGSRLQVICQVQFGKYG